MNREQKIALIIGFAVVLVVGVLVSDHLSGARHLQLADATEGDTGRIEASPVAFLPDHQAQPPQLKFAGPDTDTPNAVQPVLREPETIVEPFRFAQGGGGTDSPLGKVLASTDDPEDDSTESWRDSFTGFAQNISEGFNNGVREAAVIEPRRDQAPAGKTQHTDTRKEASPPAPVRHTVLPNQPLYKIAKQYLGDGNKWREIAAANPGKVGKDGSVRAGVTLTIPGASAPPARSTHEPAQASGKPIRYTVKPNDSLSKISQTYLGTTKRMDEIVAANRGKIDDPDDIRVGMVLTIPSKS